MKSFVFNIVRIDFCFGDMIVEIWGSGGCDSDIVWEGDIPGESVVQRCVKLLPMFRGSVHLLGVLAPYDKL